MTLPVRFFLLLRYFFFAPQFTDGVTAGKTTILYKMKLGDFVQTIPTIGNRAFDVPLCVSLFSLYLGFNVETIKYKNVRFDCWDAGGQEKVLDFWF